MSKVAPDVSGYIEIVDLINNSNIHHPNDDQHAIVRVNVLMSMYTIIQHNLIGKK